MAVMQLNDLISELKKKKKYIILISFDVTGAFDHVKWSSILKALSKNLVPETLINLVKSFLDNRTIGHFDKDGRYSGSRVLLGPSLFNVIMAGVHEIDFHKCINIRNYANDIALLAGVDSIDGIKNIIRLIKKINLILKITRSSKSWCIVITNKGDKITLKNQIEELLRVDNERIKIVSELKYLGVVLDENLSYIKQVDYTCQKIPKYYNAFRSLYLWKQIRHVF